MEVSNLTTGKKPAPVAYPIHELLQNRWSGRAFASRPVEPEKLCAMLEAARWTASANNGQPWRFILATSDQPDEYARMLALLSERNRQWAQHAPVLLLTVASLIHESGYQNRHAWHDTGMALAQLTMQATADGLMVHAMGGFNVDAARETYAIPEGFDPVAVVAIGYYGKLEDLDEFNQGREIKERTRKPLSELVFSGTWQQSATLLK